MGICVKTVDDRRKNMPDHAVRIEKAKLENFESRWKEKNATSDGVATSERDQNHSSANEALTDQRTVGKCSRSREPRRSQSRRRKPEKKHRRSRSRSSRSCGRRGRDRRRSRSRR